MSVDGALVALCMVLAFLPAAAVTLALAVRDDEAQK